MLMNTSLLRAGTLALLVALVGCETTVSSPVVRFQRQVNYGDAKGVELVTNEFGSSDLQMIAEKMVGSLLETGIFQGRPTVTISTVKNKTSEYIDTTNVMNSIQTAAGQVGQGALHPLDPGNAGRHRRIAAPDPERPVQAEATQAKVGQMTAAKFSLEGELTSIVKQSADTKDVFYKFTLKMFDVRGRHDRMAGREGNPQDQQALKPRSPP